MIIGDKVVLKQISKFDSFHKDKHKLINKTFTVHEIRSYYGGGWRSIGLRGVSDTLYFYKARVVKAKKEGLK